MKFKIPSPRPKPLRGLFLGRFQPFHNGHLAVIRKAFETVDELIIVIGSAQESHTSENPFTADEREEMIEKTLRVERIGNCEIIPVDDIDDDDRYVVHVEGLVPDFHIVFAAENPLTATLFAAKEYPVWTCDRIKPYESTRIRELIRKGDKKWKQLVPKPVVKIIEAVEGVERVKGVSNPR